MKIRNDFVTNSSSSSFIIAYKKHPEIDPEILEKYPYLRNYQALIDIILESEAGYETEPAEVYENEEDFLAAMFECYNNGEETVKEFVDDANRYMRNIITQAIELFGKGYIVCTKDIGYDDTTTVDILHEFAKNSEDFIIISED